LPSVEGEGRSVEDPPDTKRDDDERKVPAMFGEQETVLEWARFPASVGKVDLLLGQAAMEATRRPGGATADFFEAMGIALLMAAQYPTQESRMVPGLAQMKPGECVAAALVEMEDWDLGWALELPDMARLRVLLTDLHRDLAGAASEG